MAGRNYLYTPPEGYYDIPMLWPFSVNGFTTGQNYLNQQVPIYAGYGDFILRRIVGIDRVLNNGEVAPNLTVGQFQFRDSQGRYLEEVPQYRGTGNRGGLELNTAQLAIIPELLFRENTAIRFDLYNVVPWSDPNETTTFSAQLAFHGVRRFKGVSPYIAGYKYRPKPYIFLGQVTLAAQTSPLTTTTVGFPIVNYDFEFWELRLVYVLNAFYNQAPGEGLGVFNVTAVEPGPAGNNIVLVINGLPPSPAPNLPLTVTVQGTTITVQLGTDSASNISNCNQVGNLMNATPGCAALVSVYAPPAPTPPGGGVIEDAITTGTFDLAGGGETLNSNDPWSLLQIYDQNGVGMFYSPTVDLYVNRLSYYLNGAAVPPMVYRQNTQIKVDIQSLLEQPATAMFYFVGRQRIPC